MRDNILAGATRALVIGISDYDDLEPLKFCKNDGVAMLDILSSLGYQINNSSNLIGYVTWQNMRDGIINFFTDSRVKPTDTLLFYYSGHGVPDEYGDMYFATSEIDHNIPYRRGYSFNELAKMVQRTVSTRIVVILDCCYSGSANLSKGQEDDVARLGTAAIDRGSRILQGEGRCILAASQALQEAYILEEKNHSLFTYYLLQGLQGKESEVFDQHGNITVDTLSSYVYNRIMSLPLEKRPKQKPLRKIEASGDIVLAYFPQFTKKFENAQFTMLEEANIIDEGDEYLKNKEYHKALKYYEKAVLDHNDSRKWANKALALANLGRLNEALKCYNVSLEMDSLNTDAWEQKGFVLHNLGDHHAASVCAEKAIQLYAGDDSKRLCNLWYLQGISLRNEQKVEEALKCYDRAIGIYPNAEFAHVSKGDLYMDLEKYDLALSSYEKALNIDQELSIAWNGKGRVLSQYGRYLEAIKCYDKAIQFIDIASTKMITIVGIELIWNNKGVALHNIKKYQEAIECYDKAIQINRKKPLFWVNKGASLKELERYHEAIQSYDKAIEISPVYSSALEGKASTLDKIGRSEESLKYFDRSIEENPRNIYAWVNKGIALARLSKYDEAIYCCDKAIEIDSKQSTIWTNKGYFLHQLGREKEAIDCYNRSLKINPNNKDTLEYKSIATESLHIYDSNGKVVR